MRFGSHMDGCGNFMKYSLFFTNLVIFIGGVILAVLGVWTVCDKSFANELLGTNLYVGSAYVLIVTGILVSFVSCLGCFGAIREVRCLLVMYFIAVFLIFVTMLVGGILGYVFREKVGTTMRNTMLGALRLYDQNKAVAEAWDATQTRLKCCGVTSYEEWISVPDSCCKPPAINKLQRCHLLISQNDTSSLYRDGCLNVTTAYVRENAAIIGGAGIGVAGLTLFGMIFSCALIKLIE